MAWDLIGHEWAVEMLSHHVAASQVRHAYLLSRPEGVGSAPWLCSSSRRCTPRSRRRRAIAAEAAFPAGKSARIGIPIFTKWLEGKARRFSGSRPSGELRRRLALSSFGRELGGLPCSPASTMRQSKLRTPC